MKKLKYLILNRLSGRLGLGVLSIALTRRLSRLTNRPVSLKPESGFSTSNFEATEFDLDIIRRLLKFWNASQESLSTIDLGETLWSEIQSSQVKFYKLMDEGNLQHIYNYLVAAPTQSICKGILQGNNETMMLKINPKYKMLMSKITVNRFVALVEGIGGGYTVQNPEQGVWGVKKDFDFDESIKRLDAEFGIPIKSPNIFTGLLLTKIGSRKFNQVDIMALNASLQIRKALENSTSKSIIEIGAGSGITAYWCNRLKLGPIQIIDLPHIAIVQAFYLLKSLPDANIILFGEKLSSNLPDIAIYPHWAFNELPMDSTELVFNQDSFAEMSKSTVQNYLRWIGSSGARHLLSINHESGATYNAGLTGQINISGLIRDELSFIPISRHPNWVRTGYVDQLWRIKEAIN